MSSYILRIIFLTVLILTAALLAQAQASRTWVSGVGDDANPCSRTAPCKTFAGAITKTAAGGEIDCIDNGAFGAVNITKALTIDCTGSFGSVLATTSGGAGITVAAGAIDVVRIRGLSINGLNMGQYGIRINSGGKVYVENTVIDGFLMYGISHASTGPTGLIILNSVIRNNTNTGINIMPLSTLTAMSAVNVVNTQIIDNIQGGINAQTSNVAVKNCVISGGVTGIQASQNGNVLLSGSSVNFFNTAISVGSKGIINSTGNNSLFGNGNTGTFSGTQSLQ